MACKILGMILKKGYQFANNKKTAGKKEKKG